MNKHITFPNKNKEQQILAIIDYDDTLLASSHIQDLIEEKRKEVERRKRQRKRNHSGEENKFKDNDARRSNAQNKENENNSLIAAEQQSFWYLEDAAITLIVELCKRSSKVVIISNAEARWISYTLTEFFPRLGDIIMRNNVSVVSARDLYNQGAQLERPLQWKVHAFRSCTEAFSKEINKLPFTLLSIGDSDHERKAAKIASLEQGASMLTIKLLETPSLHQLHRQLEHVCMHIDAFVGNFCEGSKHQVELVVATNGLEITHETADTSIDRPKVCIISH